MTALRIRLCKNPHCSNKATSTDLVILVDGTLLTRQPCCRTRTCHEQLARAVFEQPGSFGVTLPTGIPGTPVHIRSQLLRHDQPVAPLTPQPPVTHPHAH